MPQELVGCTHADARGNIRFCNDFDMSAVRRFYTITTDGAPAWEPKEAEIVESWKCGSMEILKCCGGRMLYLKGYRQGTRAVRIQLLVDALSKLANSKG